MFIRLYRLFCGYVKFTACNGFTERFINLCGMEGIYLWNISRSGGGITACTKASDYLRIRSCASRSGMKISVAEKHGLPFFIKKYKTRIGLLYGIVIAVCFLCIMSTMVWSINISGNNVVTDEQILTVLAQAGVRHGTLRKNVDAASVRFFAMEKLPELSYLTVNVLGSCVEVKVSEQADGVHIADTSVPCDVVSTVDGQIAALEVYRGTALHKKGEAVRAGQALAGGFVELSDGSVKKKHAEAYALIRTDIDFETTVTKEKHTLELTKEEHSVTLHILGIDIPLGKPKAAAPDITRSHTLILNGVNMPFSVTTEIRRTYTQAKSAHDEKELLLVSAENHLEKKIAALSAAHICTQQLNRTADENGITVSASYLAEISAGKAKEMLTE